MNKATRFTSILAFLAIVSITLISCSTLAPSSSQSGATVSVSGTGTVYLKADMVTFSININETAQTTAEAQQATNRKITAVLDILKSFKLGENDISTTALNFNTEYYWDNGKQVKTGESVSQTVYVTMKDIESFSKLADEMGKAISGIQLYNVRFDSSDKESAYTKARELAYEDALKKAQLYANSAGMAITGAQAISEGYSSYTTASYKTANAMVMEAAAASVMDYGTQTPTGLLTASIEVSVVFGLR